MKSRAEIKAEMFKVLSKYTGKTKSVIISESDKAKLESLRIELNKMNELEKFTETI